MEHKGTMTLETQRLILRPFTENDAAAMCENWASDPQVTKYLTWTPHQSLQTTSALMADWVSRYGDEQNYMWAIELKELGQPIGSISVVKQDAQTETVQLGYCIGTPWWNRGITTEALNRLIRFFFLEVGVNRIEARHDPRNPHSGSVMRKCAMTYEGTLREADHNNQGVCDTAMYSILRREFSPA